MKSWCYNNLHTILLAVFVMIISVLFSYTLDKKDDKSYVSIEVNEGDTLWTIADRYKETDLTKVEFIGWIEEHNEIRADSIEAGKEIVIPVKRGELIQNLAGQQ